MDIKDKLIKTWIRVVKTTTKQHTHDDVSHRSRGQMSHVKTTTLLFSKFVYHRFHFYQDPRLYHSLTKPKLFQDGQRQLMMTLECGIIMASYNSYKNNEINPSNHI